MEPNAILAINSLDRYTIPIQGGPQLLSTALIQQYNTTGQPCNQFQIQSPGALIYGYISKIQVSQTQLLYNIPTVIPGRNDLLYIFSGTDQPFLTTAIFNIPFGFYNPQELAAILQIQIRASDIGKPGGPATGFTVIYSNVDGFVFSSNSTFTFYFPTLAEIQVVLGMAGYSTTAFQITLKCYRLLGLDIGNSQIGLTSPTVQMSNNTPNFLYTPYIDIISETLTKYQKIQDTDSSPLKQSSIVSRIYMAGTGPPQLISGDTITTPIGSRPFLIVQDLNYCKCIRWSRDEAVNSLDFTLRDVYGDLIFERYNSSSSPVPNPNAINDTYYTEFQMTLLCIEEENR